MENVCSQSWDIPQNLSIAIENNCCTYENLQQSDRGLGGDTQKNLQWKLFYLFRIYDFITAEQLCGAKSDDFI